MDVKRSVVETIALLVFLVFAGTLNAQGFLFPSADLASLGSSLNLELSLQVGLVDCNEGFKLTNTWKSDNYSEYNWQPLRGVWLGGSLALDVTDDMKIIISGGSLPPNESGSMWSSSPVLFDQTDLVADFQWGLVSTDIEYSLGGIGELLVGFRWDHFTTRYTNPVSSVGYYNYVMNWYLPYVGLQSTFGPVENNITARVIGFPRTPGSAKCDLHGSPTEVYIGEFSLDRGSFIECVLTYACKPFQGAHVELFGKFNWMESHTSDLIEETSGNDQMGFALDLSRKTWTFGVSAGYEF
jgi:hypothetical protein